MRVSREWPKFIMYIYEIVKNVHEYMGRNMPGMLVSTYDSSTQEAEAGGALWSRPGATATQRNPDSKIKKKKMNKIKGSQIRKRTRTDLEGGKGEWCKYIISKIKEKIKQFNPKSLWSWRVGSLSKHIALEEDLCSAPSWTGSNPHGSPVSEDLLPSSDLGRH